MNQTRASTRKSPNICSSCRLRKVRCDGRRSVCGNCDRLGLGCSFQESSLSSEEGSVQRCRARRACVQCHSRKSRCSGEIPSCQRCKDKGLDCVYPVPKQATSIGFATPSPTVEFGYHSPALELGSEPGPEQHLNGMRDRSVLDGECLTGLSPLIMEPIDRNAYPPEALMQQALELFFHHIYPIPVFSFLHQATITERYYAGTLDKCLAFAIVGIVSVMFDIDEATKRRGGRYVDIAEDAIVSSRESPAVSKIQALVIIIKYRAARRQFAAVFMLTAIAMRSATALRMNYEDHSLSFLTREECRRTMWSLYMIDTILAGGYQDFSLCPDDIIHIQLPCHERNYELDLPADVENRIDRDVMVRTADLSSLSLAIRVMSLRHRVLKFTKKVVALQSLGFHDGVVELQAELDMFSNQLPQALRFSEKNARLHSYSNSFAAFATMHIIWHGAHCILYRLVVGGFKEALPRTVLAQTDPALILHCQQKCLHHAIALADVYRVILLYRSHKPRLDVDIAVSAYQSVRIMLHLHNMLPGMVESGDLLSKVGYCQEFLDQIFPRCEAIDHVREDLKQLVDCGLSRPTTPAPPESSMEGSAAARTPGSHHILSRHSLVGQMSLPSKLESRQDNGRLTPVDDDDAERLERPPLLALEHQVSSCGDLGQNIHTTETRLDHGVRGVPSDLLGDNLSESLYPAFPDLVQFEMDSSIWLQTPLADANTIPEADQPLL